MILFLNILKRISETSSTNSILFLFSFSSLPNQLLKICLFIPALYFSVTISATREILPIRLIVIVDSNYFYIHLYDIAQPYAQLFRKFYINLSIFQLWGLYLFHFPHLVLLLNPSSFRICVDTLLPIYLWAQIVSTAHYLYLSFFPASPQRS